MAEQDRTIEQSVVFLGMAQPSDEVFGILSSLCDGRPITFLPKDVDTREAVKSAIPLVDGKPDGRGVFIIPIEGTNARTLKIFAGLGKTGARVQPVHDDPDGVIQDHDSEAIQEWMENGTFPEIDPYAELFDIEDDEDEPEVEVDPYSNIIAEAEAEAETEQEAEPTPVPVATPAPEATPTVAIPVVEPTPVVETPAAPVVGGFDFGGGALALDDEDTTAGPQIDSQTAYQPSYESVQEQTSEPQRPSYSPETVAPVLPAAQPPVAYSAVPTPTPTAYRQPELSGDTSIPLPGEPQVRQPRSIDDFQEPYPKDEALTEEHGEGDSYLNDVDQDNHDGGVVAPSRDSGYVEPKLLKSEDVDRIPHLAEADPISRSQMVSQINQNRRYGSPGHVRRTARSASGTCIAVTGVKGGTGKTTTTWMLANTTSLCYTSLVTRGKMNADQAPRVFLIEADLSNAQLLSRIAVNNRGLKQGNHAVVGLQALANKVDSYQAEHGSITPKALYDNIVGCSVKISRSNLYVLPAPPPGNLDPTSKEKLQAFCVMAVESLMQNGDIVFVDCDRITTTDYDPLVSTICRDRANHVVMTMIPNTKNLLAGACDLLTESQADGRGKTSSNVLDRSALHILVNEATESAINQVRATVPSYKSQVKVRIPLYPDLKMGDPDSTSTIDTWVGNMKVGDQQRDMTSRYGLFAYQQLGFNQLAPLFDQQSRVRPTKREEKARVENKPTLGGKIRGMLNRS